MTTMTTSTIMKQTCAKIDPVNTHRKMTVYGNNDINHGLTTLLVSIPTIQLETMAGIVQQLEIIKNKELY